MGASRLGSRDAGEAGQEISGQLGRVEGGALKKLAEWHSLATCEARRWAGTTHATVTHPHLRVALSSFLTGLQEAWALTLRLYVSGSQSLSVK